MQWDVRARPGFLRRGKIVGIGFARHFEHHDFDFFRHGFTVGEPLCLGPGLHQSFCMRITGFDFLSDIMKGVKHQDCV